MHFYGYGSTQILQKCTYCSIHTARCPQFGPLSRCLLPIPEFVKLKDHDANEYNRKVTGRQLGKTHMEVEYKNQVGLNTSNRERC